MRPLVGCAILLITALDLQLGRPNIVLHVAGGIAGLLLILSVIVDRIAAHRGEANGEPQDEPQSNGKISIAK